MSEEIIKEGSYEEYYKNGKLKNRTTYKDDKKNGLVEVYHENGQLWIKTWFVNNNKEGSYEEYSKNGRLEVKGTFKDDELDTSKEYYIITYIPSLRIERITDTFNNTIEENFY